MSAGPARDQALRLRVFRFILDVYDAEGRWPTEGETAREFGVTIGAAKHQLMSLHGAAGLPRPTNRAGSAGTHRRGRDAAYVTPVDAAIRDMGRRFNPETYIDVRALT